jgi:7-carboxy-7-deazaguanine synthase
MRIAEIFASLQGEGLLAGTPSTFIRTSGCNLRCIWCDTPYTSWAPEGDAMTVAEVLDRVRLLPARHAVITGGEPLVVAEAVELCRALRQAGWHITIETAGTVLPVGGLTEAIADLMSISPKLASSAPPAEAAGDWQARHQATRRQDDVLAALMAQGPYQLKFVIDSEADLTEMLAWLVDLGLKAGQVDPNRVCLMPQGRSVAELTATATWLELECHRLGFRLAPRHHVAWFGHVRGT